MKVRELIAALQDENQDLDVWTEGCDCYGPAGNVTIIGPPTYDAPYVLVEREPYKREVKE